MAVLRFRNVDAEPSDPVRTWPTEAVIAALERGGIAEWARLAAEVREHPWGPLARRLESALAASRPYGVGALMERALANARSAAATRERAEVARRVGELLERSGLDRAAFAEAVGTSTSRLSTYLNGRVAPASTLLVRMEGVAEYLPDFRRTVS